MNILVTVLTLDGNDTELATMFAGLADTAASAESLLVDLDPGVSLEIRSVLVHAREGHRENARSDLLIASHRLTRLLRGVLGVTPMSDSRDPTEAAPSQPA